MGNKQRLDLSHYSLYCIISGLIKNLVYIVLAGLAAALMAIMFMQNLYEPEYTAGVTVAVSEKNAGFGSSNLNVSTETAATLTELFQSNLFSNLAGLSLGADTIPGKLSASVIPQTNLLTISVAASNPHDAFSSLKVVLDNYDKLSADLFQNVLLRELDSPKMPTAPSNPVNQARIAKLAFIGAAALAALMFTLLICARDTVQNTKAAKDKLDMPMLAGIHHQQKNRTLYAKLRRLNKGLLITSPSAGFHFSEEIYKLSMRITQAADENGKAILITSLAENEGKSTIASNLALSLAQRGKKVLLIDADLRKPAQHKLFGYYPKINLIDILNGTQPGQYEYLQDYKLNIIFAGSRLLEGTALLASKAMQELLDKARQAMDYIIIDSPPCSLCADTEAMAELADASVLVVRQDVVPSYLINDAVDSLSQCRAELLGFVFNDIKGLPFSYDHGGYGYAYGRGYGYDRR